MPKITRTQLVTYLHHVCYSLPHLAQTVLIWPRQFSFGPWFLNLAHTLARTKNEPEGTLNWAASSEFSTYRLCEQRRFRQACASAQSRQNLRCSLIQAVSQEEPSNRKPDPWPLWMTGHAQLKFVMKECSKSQIRLTRHKCQHDRRADRHIGIGNENISICIILTIPEVNKWSVIKKSTQNYSR